MVKRVYIYCTGNSHSYIYIYIWPRNLPDFGDIYIFYIWSMAYFNITYTYIISYYVREDFFSIINYHQTFNQIDSQFYMEQIFKPENILRSIGFEPMPSDCEQET